MRYSILVEEQSHRVTESKNRINGQTKELSGISVNGFSEKEMELLIDIGICLAPSPP